MVVLTWIQEIIHKHFWCSCLQWHVMDCTHRTHAVTVNMNTKHLLQQLCN